MLLKLLKSLTAAALLAAAGARACDVQLNAQHFFDLCEAGKGANATAPFVRPGASFSAQVVDALPGPPLSQVRTVAGYSDWMAGVVQEFGPKATVDVKAAAYDASRSAMVFYAVFMGYSDYVYYLDMDRDSCKVTSMVKIWNDQFAKNNIPGAPLGAAPEGGKD